MNERIVVVHYRDFLGMDILEVNGTVFAVGAKMDHDYDYDICDIFGVYGSVVEAMEWCIENFDSMNEYYLMDGVTDPEDAEGYVHNCARIARAKIEKLSWLPQQVMQCVRVSWSEGMVSDFNAHVKEYNDEVDRMAWRGQ